MAVGSEKGLVMWIKQETRIRFEYPEDYQYEQEYIKEHDMSEWKNFQDTLGSTYVYTSNFNVAVDYEQAKADSSGTL